jgi:hypothetical protein
MERITMTLLVVKDALSWYMSIPASQYLEYWDKEIEPCPLPIDILQNLIKWLDDGNDEAELHFQYMPEIGQFVCVNLDTIEDDESAFRYGYGNTAIDALGNYLINWQHTFNRGLLCAA